MNQPYRYRIGGSLPGTAPCYVVRQADRDLYKTLTEGEFCYIFNARQMGKSSLRLRAMEQLQIDGVTCATIDMTAIGSQEITAEQWYGGILLTLVSELRLADPITFLRDWWQPRSQIAPIKRLSDFIETVLLANIQGPIVIFIDEIDSVLSLKFPTDDFFALIRSCYEQRNVNPIYQRLTFALVGVATPSSLIADPKRTPFNIGKAIQLQGFRLDEVEALTAGLTQSEQPQAMMATILEWSGGQPFLTQKICQLAIDHSITVAPEIPTLIQTCLIQNWEAQDEPPHLKTIRNRVIRQDEQLSRQLLTLYQNLLRSPDQTLQRDNSSEQQTLLLSGLAITRHGQLVPHNRIYATIFNLEWVETELARLCPYATELTLWRKSNGQDDSRLLRGNALQEALQWSQSRSISKDESQFLNRSLMAEKELTDRENSILAAENDIAVRRNIILDRAKRKAEKLVRLSTGLAVMVAVVALWILLNLQRAETISQFEANSGRMQRQFEFAPLELLQRSVEEAEKFKSFEQWDWLRWFSARSTQDPAVTLRRLASDIQELHNIKTDQRGINSMVVSGDRITTAGSNGTIKIWEKGRSTPLWEEKLQTGGINTIRYNNRGDRLITGDSKGILTIWQVAKSGELSLLVAKKGAHTGGLYNARFGPDENTIATTGEIDGQLKLWRITGNKIQPLWSQDAHKGGVSSLNFSKDNLLVTGGRDGLAKLWDLEGKLLKTFTEDASKKQPSVNSVAFYNKPKTCEPQNNLSPCNYYLLTGGNDGILRIWDRNGTVLRIIPGSGGQIRTVVSSPSGHLIAATSSQEVTITSGSLIKTWDTKTLEPVTEFRGHHGKVETIRFVKVGKGSDSDRLVTAGQDDSIVRSWQLPEAAEIDRIRKLNKHEATVNSVRFSPDGQHLLSASDDGSLRWWRYDNETGNLLANPGVWKAPGDRVKLITNRVHPKLNLIAVGANDGFIRLLKIQDNSENFVPVGQFQTDQGVIESIDFSMDTSPVRLTTTGNDDTVKTWTIDPITYQHKLEKTYNRTVDSWSVRYSRDGTKLAIGGGQGKILLIDVKSQREFPLTIDNSQSSGRAIVGFSQDSQFLVAVTESGNIQKWSVQNFPSQPPKILGDMVPTYQMGTNNIVFTKSNDQIVTVGAGNTIKIWDAKTGNLTGDLRQQRVEFRGQWGRLRTVSLSIDKKWLATGSDDGLPRLLLVDQSIEELIEKGCVWLNKENWGDRAQPRSLPKSCR
jgi:WD40 repeat protein